jgi:dUTP pyrophosphatase
MHRLNIKIMDSCPNKKDVIEYYQKKVNSTSYKGDAGIDLIFPDDVIFETNRVKKCGLGISCELIHRETGEPASFYLTPRSSIVNTPLMLANSVGVFDAGYRGEVIAALRCYIDKDHTTTLHDSRYLVSKNDRLVQVVAPDLFPICVNLVNELSSSERGERGFGSTNTR